MNTEDLKLNSALTAFSDQTIETSSREITRYVESTQLDAFSFNELIKQGDPVLISELGKMVEISTQERVSADMTDIQISELNDNILDSIKDWEREFKEVLNVVLVKKIIENFQYANKNITTILLKNVYLDKHTEDLLYIWLSIYREKIKKNL